MKNKEPVYRRVLLKLSGEALMGEMDYGIDPAFIARIAEEVKAIHAMGVEVAMVIGGGNIFRGAGLAGAGMDRVTGDHIGMLATVINSLSFQDSLERLGIYCRVMSALKIHEVCEDYVRRRAVRHLEKGRVVVFAAGTGNPFFTTDSAASLRAVEIGADVVLKATKVDGVYDKDPVKHADAVKYERVGYDEAIGKKLGVMDTTALVMCRDNAIPIKIFDLNKEGDLIRVICGEKVGSIVE
ncbi:MAG TPA: UMP kinase [Gammaproteobacteria bacterium]|jgi:uridylate kinase|nr:UMP kinase [Gammaproteobacteria bacterium]